MDLLFSKSKIDKLFKWNEGVRTALVRTQYNEMLQQVIDKDKAFLTLIKRDTTVGTDVTMALLADGGTPPSYYNTNLCLALNKCPLPPEPVTSVGSSKKVEKTSGQEEKTDLAVADKGLNEMVNNMVAAQNPCGDFLNANMFISPQFYYRRRSGNTNKDIIEILQQTNGLSLDALDAKLELNNQLPLASVIWLYYYERMGIFKILGALMDDYNYRGKFPISSKSENITSTGISLQYSELIDTICTLYRMGIGSNVRDRVTLYQRVLGVSIENNMNIESEKNENFMRNFNKLVSLSLDYYQNKQLVQAIRDTSTNTLRSSVATQTAIRDTILVLQKNMEVFEYGRNRLNTFIGIATVYATICLLRMVKDEIGVPRQYNDPDEFIPAAYDILVLKRSVTSAETNRFTIYDNCASYGFRLLADIELIETSKLTTISFGSPLDAWLNDIEGLIEGYNNAYKSILEPASAMV